MTTQDITVYQDMPHFNHEHLEQPLDAHFIKQRPGPGGRKLNYISGKTAIDTANKIFGFGCWGYKVVARSHEMMRDEKKGTIIEFYTADVELSVLGSAFSFPGDGIGIVNSPTVESHEKARKEATTDALKRALRHYGDQFGLCLYDEDSYVDNGDGTQVQVKNVKPTNSHTAQPKRVVESQPITAPTSTQLRKRCKELYPYTPWEEVIKRLFKRDIPDSEMGPEQCQAIHEAFEKVAARRAQNGTSGK